MIKIFWGAGVVTPSKPPPPYEQLLPLPVLRSFLERSLSDPPPPTTPLQTPFTATPSPSTTPSPPKNFDHTPICNQNANLSHYTHDVKEQDPV